MCIYKRKNKCIASPCPSHLHFHPSGSSCPPLPPGGQRALCYLGEVKWLLPAVLFQGSGFWVGWSARRRASWSGWGKPDFLGGRRQTLLSWNRALGSRRVLSTSAASPLCALRSAAIRGAALHLHSDLGLQGSLICLLPSVCVLHLVYLGPRHGWPWRELDQ